MRAAVRLARSTAAAVPAAGSAAADGGPGGGARDGSPGHRRRPGQGGAGRRGKRRPGPRGREPIGARRPAAAAGAGRSGRAARCGWPSWPNAGTSTGTGCFGPCSAPPPRPARMRCAPTGATGRSHRRPSAGRSRRSGRSRRAGRWGRSRLSDRPGRSRPVGRGVSRLGRTGCGGRVRGSARPADTSGGRDRRAPAAGAPAARARRRRRHGTESRTVARRTARPAPLGTSPPRPRRAARAPNEPRTRRGQPGPDGVPDPGRRVGRTVAMGRRADGPGDRERGRHRGCGGSRRTGRSPTPRPGPVEHGRRSGASHRTARWRRRRPPRPGRQPAAPRPGRPPAGPPGTRRGARRPTIDSGVGRSDRGTVPRPPLRAAADPATEPTGESPLDWPWAGQPGDSPIGDLLIERLRANREAARERGGRGAHHGVG